MSLLDDGINKADVPARAMGMLPIVIDSGAEKEALAKRCGAIAFIDFKKESNVAGKVIEVAGGIGAHGVMVTAWQTYKGMFSARRVV
jgi:alcohol dehydrogenase, propanol-preferring